MKERHTTGMCMAFLLGLAAAGCGGGSSSSSQSTTTQQTNPVPSITSLSPSSATAGAAAQTLTLTGTNFLTSSTATYNGVAHTVTYVSSAQLTIQLSASDQGTAGSYPVVVTNPTPGGGASNSANFTVNSSASSGAVAPSFFSMTVGFTGTLTWPALPIGTLGELTAAGWASVEPSNGQFDWGRLDQAIAVAQANGVTTINYNMHTTPLWAAADPSAPCEFSFLTACSSPPASIDDWNNYVTALVTRYKGKINYYELWDEADYSEQWSGTIQQFLSMAQSAYGIIKSVDPNAQVLTPGVTVSAVQPITNDCGVGCWLASYLQAGGAKYADGVTFHGFYCQNSQCPAGIGCNVAIDCAGTPLLTQIGYVRSAMNENGLSGKPLFDTSGSWGRDTNLPDSFQQAAYVARWCILQAAAGVKIADWWGWDVGEGDLGSTSSGLNVAGQAYTTVNGWLVGATVTSACALSGSIWSCGFSRPNGYQAQIVWSSVNSSDTATSSYTPPSQFTQYRDLAGNTTSTTGAPIDVGMQPIILETGPPHS